MRRREFLGLLGAGLSSLSLAPGSLAAKMLESAVTTNRLRPPGGVPEEIFPAKCIRCGRCVEVCPYRCIVMLDIRAGISAGTPLVEVEKIPCYLCMKCVDVCSTGSLQRVRQEDTRMGLAVVNRFLCAAWVGTTLCRTCYDKCPYADRAIRLDQLRPVVDPSVCTGCGLCTNACPVSDPDGKKAVNIEPIFAASTKVGKGCRDSLRFLAFCRAHWSLSADCNQPFHQFLLLPKFRPRLVPVPWRRRPVVCFTPGGTGKPVDNQIAVSAVTCRHGYPGNHSPVSWPGLLFVDLPDFIHVGMR